MSTYFNIKRFALLLKKTLLEQPIQLFGLTTMTLALVLLLYIISRDIMGYSTSQSITFFLGLVGGGFFLSGSVFANFNSYSKGASYLTLPASTLEKWLSGMVIVLVLYLPVFLVFYKAMDTVLLEVYLKNLDPNSYDYKHLVEDAKPFELNSSFAIFCFKLFLNICGFMMLGSLWYNKLGIIKVAMLICGIVLLAIGFNYIIANALFDEKINAFPFLQIVVKTKDNHQTIAPPAYAQSAINVLFYGILPLSFFLISFLKLREKEF